MKIEFKWIGGATWILDIQGLRIACDPVLCPAGTVQNYGFFSSKRLDDPVVTEDDFRNIDIWLITHGHEDHLDKADLSCIERNTKVITHKNALRHLQKAQIKDLVVLHWGEKKSYEIKGTSVNIEAIPAVHGVKPLVAFFAGGVNGYWMTMQNNAEHLSIYVTSDTILHRKVHKTLQGRQVDLLIPNMGAVKKGSWMGPLTLSASMLNTMVDMLQPKLCIPVHFGTFEHYVEPISEVEKLQHENIVILEPGQTYTKIYT